MMGWHSVVTGRKAWMTRKLSDHTTEVHEIIYMAEFIYLQYTRYYHKSSFLIIPMS